jgi:XTP/dITP diphosphohydrolase
MRELLIATSNLGKIHEIRALLQDLPLRLISPADLGLEIRVDEDGKTYAENASKKALAFAGASGLAALADDSGLEVDALGGDPGLHSARYLQKEGATDAERRAYLLQNLSGTPHPWSACFRSCVAIAVPEHGVAVAAGECHGEIIAEERGSGGFGYDRIFFLPDMGCTMAELSMEAKNRLSHRAQAVVNARPILQNLIAA